MKTIEIKNFLKNKVGYQKEGAKRLRTSPKKIKDIKPTVRINVE